MRETALQIAAETGRLDFASALLGSIAVLLALGAIPVFLLLRYRASEVARQAAEEELHDLKDRVEKLAIDRLEALLPGLVEDYMNLAGNAVSAEPANEIARYESGHTGE